MVKEAEKDDILIVDDHINNLQILMTFLKPEGYRIRVAKNGLQALESIKKKKPKLILLDIQMPEMDGYEVCRKLKADNSTSNIPIIFISALSQTIDKVKAFSLGAVDYIEKPFQIEEVVARVFNHITLRNQRDQLALALKKVKYAQNKLIQSDKMISLGVMSAGIAHEINNPINFVSTGAMALDLDVNDLIKLLDLYDRLDSNCIDPKHYKEIQELKQEIDYNIIRKNIALTIKDIRDGVKRTTEIVNGLKRFSRLDNGEKFELNIHEEILSVITIIERLSKKNISFVQEFDANINTIEGYPGQLNQLFMNIISNAEQAIDEDKVGLIKVKTRAEQNGVRVLISDNGCGIPEDLGQRIFEPFLTTKEVGVGTGLGLSISFGIVENHKGRITYESKVNHGTTFNIYIPKK